MLADTALGAVATGLFVEVRLKVVGRWVELWILRASALLVLRFGAAGTGATAGASGLVTGMPVTMSYTWPFMVVVLLSLFIKSRIGGSA